MFFIGQLAASGYTSQVRMTELINIITGAITSTAGLSSSVWVPGTAKLVNTVPSGWSVADAAAGAVVNAVQPVVIAAPWSDDATKSKNVLMGDNIAATPGYLAMRGYETWNSTTHAGTNPHAVPSIAVWSMPLTSSMWVIISASANHLFICQSQLNGSTSAGFGNSPCYYFLSEYSRDDVWNTVANGYPSWFACSCTSGAVGSANTSMSICRTLNTNTMTDVVSQSWGSTTSNIARIVPYAFTLLNDQVGAGLECVLFYTSNVSSAFGSSATKQQGLLLSPLRLLPGLGASVVGTPSFGSIGAKTPFLYQFKPLWVSGDEVVINNETYLYLTFGNSANNAFLLREA